MKMTQSFRNKIRQLSGINRIVITEIPKPKDKTEHEFLYLRHYFLSWIPKELDSPYWRR